MGMLLVVSMLAARAAEPSCVDRRAEAPAAVAEQLRDIIASGANDRALERVSSAEQQLPCLAHFVTSEDLASMYQLAGTATFYSERRDAAAPLFRRAVVVAPTIPFDRANLGADAGAAYDAARIEVAAGPTGTVLAVGPVVVDGSTIRPGSSVVLPAGVHLVQEGADGGVRSTLLEVADGARLRVGTPDPSLVAARKTLETRRRGTAYVASATLALVAGGLYGAAVAQEDALDALDPESVADPAQRARSAQFGANAAVSGAVLALGSSVALAVRALTLEVELFPGMSSEDAPLPRRTMRAARESAPGSAGDTTP
jgi:hypothetical protein